MFQSCLGSLQACSRFVNVNAVTRSGRGSTKSPELLARYCDALLKKSAKNPDESEMEEALQAVVCCATLYAPKSPPND